jgi:hypothetical protein
VKPTSTDFYSLSDHRHTHSPEDTLVALRDGFNVKILKTIAEK